MRKLFSQKKNSLLLYSILILFLIALMAVGFYLTNEPKHPENKKNKKVKDRATISIQPLMFSQEIENKNKFILSATSAKFYQEEGKGVLNNFTITYIYNGGKKITINGVKADVNMSADKNLSQDMSIANIYTGGIVTAVSSDGYRFETKDLVWEGAKKIISTKEPIIFYGNSFKVTGEGLKADINNEELEITSKVSVTAVPESLEKLKNNNRKDKI